MVVKKYCYRPGTNVFETPNGSVGGTRWAVWIALLDGKVCKQEEALDDYVSTTLSSKRRWRRKMGRQSQ